MRLRSLLFVPGDRPERFPKAVASGCDAVILDLEDSVSADRKAYARSAIAEWLSGTQAAPAFVRINPLDGGEATADLAALAAIRPAGVVLPKAEGPAGIEDLVSRWAGSCPPILPIASETPAAVFQLGAYGRVADRLAGLTWGAEDLPAAIGASSAREPDGRYTSPYELVRALTLFGAHAAGVSAIETVFPDLGDRSGLAGYVTRARRDGFNGMMAIHPSQVEAITQGFRATPDEIARARAVIAAFAADPQAGALKLDGRMVDRPHLVQARRILAQSDGPV